jgi:hypothetical protein
MHGNVAIAWEETDSDECPQCKAVRLEWHEIMDDTETVRIRSDGWEVSDTTVEHYDGGEVSETTEEHSDGGEVSETTEEPENKK